MSNPEANGNPSKYGDDKYLSLDMEGVNESQLVHNNSTVLSRAFYLMWKNGLTTDEISQIMLETCVRLSRFAEYNEIIEMIRILAEEYCPEKVDIVTDALVETGYMYYIEDEQGNNNNGTTTTEQDIADIYKQFIIDKGYEKDEDEYFEEAKYYAILDINKDVTPELFIQDEGTTIGFCYTMLYTYDNATKQIKYIDSLYSYGRIRYDTKNNEIVYASFNPFKDAGANDFYKFENNEIVWSKTVGYKGENYTDYFVNSKENGEKSITQEQSSSYYDNVEAIDYIEISDLIPSQTGENQIGTLSDIIEEAKKESIEPGKIQAGDHTISYGIYRSNLAEYEMLGGIYIIRKDGTYTYRNIWKNYAGEVNTVNISGTYTVQYFDELDIDEAGWAIKFTSNSDEIMGNTVLEINENDSFEAGQYPNKFALIQ